MAYTIKKKVKKTEAELPDIEEVRSLFSKVFEERRQAVLGALGVIAVIVVLGIAITVFRSGRIEDSTELENKALAAFYDPGALADNYAETLELFKKAEAVRSSALAQIYKAEAYLKSGQTDLAKETYSRFVTREPDAPLASAARLKLALIAVADGKTDEAVGEMESLAQDVMVGDTALYHLSVLYEGMGQNDKKLEVLKTLAAQFPKSPWAPEAIRFVEESSAATQETEAPGQPVKPEASE